MRTQLKFCGNPNFNRIVSCNLPFNSGYIDIVLTIIYQPSWSCNDIKDIIKWIKLGGESGHHSDYLPTIIMQMVIERTHDNQQIIHISLKLDDNIPKSTTYPTLYVEFANCDTTTANIVDAYIQYDSKPIRLIGMGL